MANFNEILQRMLNAVPDGIDKRQGSIIYDSLAPAAIELAQMYVSLEIFQEQTYLLTATGINLDNKAADSGIERHQATKAMRIAETRNIDNDLFDLPIGSRFGTTGMTPNINYTLIEYISTGICLLECETVGAIGNQHLGAILPLFSINDLGSAIITGTQIPAADIETDEQLRERVLNRITLKAFGGNVADYKRFVTDIDGVGDVKVFPFWNGGGTVKLSILDSEYNEATTDFINIVQTKIDPVPNSGDGLGLAPIGHRVMVTTPTPININVNATLTLRTGYEIPQIQAAVNYAIGNYLLSIRKDWANSTSLFVFIARINSAILSVDGVENVTNITINGSVNDLELIQKSNLQQLPKLGTVVLSRA